MTTTFRAISLSYKSAPIIIRESVSLNEDSIKRLYETFRNYLPIQNVLIVSTCNRTEVYYNAEKDFSEEIMKLIAFEKQVEFTAISSYFRILNDQTEAITHLFAVSLGLESQVIGDLQISSQVKKSYKLSADADAAGPFLHRLMHTIFAASKRVQQETCFRDGAASVSYATVELAKELSIEILNPTVLIVGLGEIGTDVFKNLMKSDFSSIKISNRTLEKAIALAEGSNAEIVEWNNIAKEIQSADVIISAVPGIQPFFTKEAIEKISIPYHKVFIDLSIPRSIEPSIEEVNGALLYNVDDIKNKAGEALEKRKSAIPQVQRIIEESISGFSGWSKEMEVTSVIGDFKDALDKIRQEEINRHIKNLTSEESEKIDLITKGIVQKILKLPVLQLKSACQRGNADQLSDVLRELFDLEGKKEQV